MWVQRHCTVGACEREGGGPDGEQCGAGHARGVGHKYFFCRHGAHAPMLSHVQGIPMMCISACTGGMPALIGA
jgi:hypothetical protein